MPGRIRDEDVALVRERSSIAEVVGQVVQLRPAGSGRLKGLCPFHDEKTPSFSVSPSQGLWHCFGCQAGGDVIKFVRDTEHLSFVDAVESLARRAGVTLHYEGGTAGPTQQAGQRQRMLDAVAAAAEFYAAQLATPDAAAGRSFLAERGFDEAAAERFSVGYAPRAWDVLLGHLRGKGFRDDELERAGLAKRSSRGSLIDPFRDRLVWPIRDVRGDVVGFGARRLSDDDQIAAKYLNTPETPLFKKSSLLYGLDVAKGAIARRQQAVVVEGYTDVMACHLAGVETAVATCGTAFGAEHVAALQRILGPDDRGRVIFTFDGDAAGQKAAERAQSFDQRLVSQTFVAIAPDNLDPCDLRRERGDAAVRDLVASHVPLVEFAIRSTVARYDLTIPEGRVAALNAAAPFVVALKDRALTDEYSRRLAGWVGLEVEPVLNRVRELSGPVVGQQRRRPPVGRPDPRDPRLMVQRETLKIAIQQPSLLGPVFDGLDPATFSAPAYAAVFRAIIAAGGTTTASGGEPWVARIGEAAADDAIRALVVELAVEPLHTTEANVEHYADSHLARLQEFALAPEINQLRSMLQRMNPVEQRDDYDKLFGRLIALEQQRQGLGKRAAGAL